MFLILMAQRYKKKPETYHMPPAYILKKPLIGSAMKKIQLYTKRSHNSLDLLFCLSVDALEAAAALHLVLHLDVELNLRLCS
jgi:hypothetical protein